MNFKQKIESFQDLPKGDVVDYAVAKLEEIKAKETLYFDLDEEKRGKDLVFGEAKDSTARLTGLLMDSVTPKYQPETVEEEVTIPLPTSSHDLKGIIDVRTTNEIMDIKTSKRVWDQEKADRDPQMTFYSMMHFAKTRINLPVVIENLVDGTKTRVETIKTIRDNQDYERLINRINTAIEGITKGVFMPTTPDSWICSPRFCGYYSTCPYVKK